MRRTAALSALAFAVAAVIVPSASAQYALGDGRVLDRNPELGSGGVNQIGAPMNFRARNLLVTGDVPGGRAFRDSVGYTAARDFRGQLGSDDLFAERSFSAFSDVNFVNMGSTAEQLRFGQGLGLLDYRRSAAPPVRQDLALREGYVTRQTISDQFRMNRLMQATESTETTARSVQPRVVGVTEDLEGQMLFVNASSLRGLTLRPVEEATSQFQGLTELDLLRLREQGLQEDGELVPAPPVGERQRPVEGEEVGNPFRVNFDSLRTGAQAMEAESLGAPQEVAQVQTRVDEHDDYEQILETVARRYVGADNVTWNLESRLIKQLGDDYEALREELTAGRAPTDATAEGEPIDPLLPPGTTATTPPFGIGTDEGEEVDDGEEGEDGEIDAPRRSMTDFGIVLRHGERIDQLASPDKGRFNELMRSAEERLRDGEYFWAERRFLRALNFVPGHPLATAGLGHAQLGAGLYGSAALTLRSLMTHQPEMIDTRYDQALLPNRLRMNKAVDELRAAVELGGDRSSEGFMIAYIGHQLDDPELVAEGLAVMEQTAADDSLFKLIRRVWLGSGD